jgi:hypothetical protein
MPAFMRGSPWLFAPVIAPLLLDGLQADPRATHAMVQESEVPSWEDRPAVFPIKTISTSLTAAV